MNIDIHSIYTQHCQELLEFCMNSEESLFRSRWGLNVNRLLEIRFDFVGYEHRPVTKKNKLIIMQQLQQTMDDICNEQYRAKDVYDLYIQEKELLGALKYSGH